MNEETSTQGPGTEMPPKTSGLAIASLILAVTCIGAPIAVILGIIALIQMARNPRLRGQGLAIAGIVVSALALVILPIIAAIMIPVFVRAKQAAEKTACIANLKQLNTAMQMYSVDYNGYFPAADKWNETLEPYYKQRKVLICPSADSSPSYGMNDLLGAIRTNQVMSPAETVTFFDSTPGPNQSDGAQLLPDPPRHNGANNIGFADGHVKAVSGPSTLVWKPGSATPGSPPDMPSPVPPGG